MRLLNEKAFGLIASTLSIAILLFPHARADDDATVSKKHVSEDVPSGNLRGLQFSWGDSMGSGTGNIRSGARTSGGYRRGSGSASSTAVGIGPTYTAARGGWGNFGGDTTSGMNGVTTGYRDGQMGADYSFSGGNNVGPYSYSYSVAGGAGTQVPRGMNRSWRRLQSTGTTLGTTHLRGPVRVAAVGVSEDQAVRDADAMMASANQMLYNIGSYRSPSAPVPMSQSYAQYPATSGYVYGPEPIDPHYPVATPVHESGSVATDLTEGHFNTAACQYFVQDGLFCTSRNGDTGSTCSGNGYPLCLQPSSQLSPYYVAVPEGQMMPTHPVTSPTPDYRPVATSPVVAPDAYTALSNAQYLMHQANNLLEQIDTAFPSA